MTEAYDKLNSFERIIHQENWGGDDGHPARKALRDIGDTMYACREWFEAYSVPYTGADVAAMAGLVAKREREIVDEIKRGKWERDHRIGEDA
jgi:hypothetical protein